jgi:hypothetical protein
MPDPVTPPAAPAEPGGVAERIEKWFEGRLAPDLASLRADAADALRFTAAHAQNLNAVAELILKLVQTADPTAAPAVVALAGEAERLTAETARVAAELAAKM